MRKKSFYSALNERKDIAKEKGDTVALDFLEEVASYVSKGEFSSNKKASKLSKQFLKSSMDSLISAKMGISESTVRAHRRNLSMELYGLFGGDFFDLFNNVEGNKFEILRRIYIVENLNLSLDDRLVVEALSLIMGVVTGCNKDELSDVKLSHCKSEIAFIKAYSKANMEKAFNKLSPKRLMYVLSVMNGRLGTTDERFSLLNSLANVGGDK